MIDQTDLRAAVAAGVVSEAQAANLIALSHSRAGARENLVPANIISQVVVYSAIGAAIIWALSEYFICHRRMIAPAITLTIFWAINAAIGLTAMMAQPFMVAQDDLSSLPLPLAAATGAILVWR